MANENETCKIKSTIKSIGRRNVVPVIHVRGTHYEIGFDIVRIRQYLFDGNIDFAKTCSLNRAHYPFPRSFV